MILSRSKVYHNVPLWSKTGTEVQTYIVDGNKNVRQLKNAAGTVITTNDYDPFGNVTSTGTPSPWQFSSECRDAETGLVYYNYRYYAPTIGRWISRDPIAEGGGMNLYNYTLNNVINIYDILGLDSCKVTLWMGHNHIISGPLNPNPDDILRADLAIGCGLDKKNIVRNGVINGYLMPKTSGRAEFMSAAQGSLHPLDIEDRNIDESSEKADWTLIRETINSVYSDVGFNWDGATTDSVVYWYVQAHLRWGRTIAELFSADKRCKNCCPDGIQFEVVVVEGMDIIYTKGVENYAKKLKIRKEA